jgi:hypothetical protein
LAGLADYGDTAEEVVFLAVRREAFGIADI